MWEHLEDGFVTHLDGGAGTIISGTILRSLHRNKYLYPQNVDKVDFTHCHKLSSSAVYVPSIWTISSEWWRRLMFGMSDQVPHTSSLMSGYYFLRGCILQLHMHIICCAHDSGVQWQYAYRSTPWLLRHLQNMSKLPILRSQCYILWSCSVISSTHLKSEC